jgi:putative hydrolase of the HAD superfamily
MSSIAAVIFDLDDTLYPEREYAYSGFSAVAQAFADRLGNPADSAAAMRRLLDSEHRPRVFDSLLAELGLKGDAELVGRMIEVYRNHRPTIRLLPDADVVLNELRGAFRLGLLSDGRTTTQWAKIDALCLRDRFDAIVITSELGPGFGKPSPRPFDCISTRLQVVGSRSVYVADNPAKDFLAPNAIGWTTVQVRRADGLYRDQTPPPGGEPEHVIEGLEQLAQLLQG